ncbi:MAG TPA: adenylate/guanylate cyclase domain-containing protein [Acidimicrobiia bacterium]|nr:adenylate/guanylate cyclase domain-containing protein [Acidimicrobiia bacterium]
MNTPSRPLPDGAVTFLFTDIEGSTQHWEQTPEAMRTAMAVHNQIVGDALAAHGGVVFKTVGDAFYAAFADPVSALEAAIEAQRALNEATWPTDPGIRVRVGIHTGTARSEDGDYSGPTLNRVARLMATGHGGQILVSSATQRLSVDSLPDGVGLRSLGVYHLKDLDRPEEIFQVVVGDTAEEFSPLRTVEPESSQLAAQARAAFQAKKWEETRDLLIRIEQDQPLTGAQHDMLANALWWLGRHEEMTARFESAFNTFLTEENPQSAAMAALVLSEAHNHALAPDVSRAWERRAERLLEDDADTDSVARGHLLRWQTVREIDGGHDYERAVGLSRRVMEIARAQGDGNLEALALQDQGRILVAKGEMEEGMALMDEAMLAAMAGDVTPMVVGRSFCNMLAVCDQTGDIRRAGQWSEAADRWCAENDHGPYPGVCRIFKAELLWHKGEWVKAESEVMRASTELGMLTDVIGEAWYQYGEMRLRAGDDTKAEEAFQNALTRGREPVPGYAVLLARRGDVASGLDLLERTLRSPGLTPWARARILPALIQLALEAGELDKAETGVEELREIGRISRSELFAAQARAGAGRIALVRGESAEAMEALRDALKTFNALGLPFEAALIHADLASAYREDGASTLADMELRTALAEFERLGAVAEADMIAASPE